MMIQIPSLGIVVVVFVDIDVNWYNGQIWC